MKMSFWGRMALVGVAFLSFGSSATFAQADSTLRQLAEARGRFVGAILNSGWFSYGLGDDVEVFENTHKSQFNMVVAENEMKFDATEPARNSFSFKNGDKLMAYAAANGMQVRGHALAWHSQVPQWVPDLAAKVEKAGGSARDTLLAVLKNHIENVVGHYKGKIREWDVVNEAVDGEPATWRPGTGENSSVWYKYIGREFIDSAFVWAHKADPDAKLYYNDYSLEWGNKAEFVLDSVAKRLKSAGIYITGVGTQTHLAEYHSDATGRIKALAQGLEAAGMTLQITEIDVGCSNANKCDYEVQGHIYRQFMDMFLESPNMEAFMIWGVSDKYSWLPDQYKYNGLIFDSSFAKKPAYDSLVASLKAHSADKVTKVKGAIPLVWENTSPFGKASYVIVDYSQPGAESRGEWSGDVKNGNGKFVGDALAGKTGYMNVPLAGCDQNADYCGYQHAIYTLPQDAVDSNFMAKCEALMFTVYGPSGGTAYVNVGANEPWMTLQNGRPLAAKNWSSMTVDLQAVRDSAAKPTQLTFNSSNTSAMYVAKIEVVGCPDENTAAIAAGKMKNSAGVVRFDGSQLVVPANSQVDVFDMQGRPVFRAQNVSGSVSLASVSKGLYVVRVTNGSRSLVHRISLK